MKAVLDLTKAITDHQYFKEQFEGSGTEKNILFVAPQLSSKHLYKFILPFFSFYNEKVYTGITGLDKYNPYEQIVDLRVSIDQKQILWATHIVFPFTTMDLSKEYGFYQAIREVNPSCKIVFYVDFNFYELTNEHPHKELFGFKQTIENTERNILFSDICITNNIKLRGYLHKKLEELANYKYADIEHIPVNFFALPYLIDEEIVLQNVEFELHKPLPVIKGEIFEKVAGVADEIKKEDLQTNKGKAKKLANKKPAPKQVTTKTKKVVANKKKNAKEKEPEPLKKKGKGKASQKQETPPALPPIPIIETKVLPKKYRVGVICTANAYSDIKFYNDVFQKINDRYGDNVTLIFYGYDYKEDKIKILNDVNFEYIEQVSIIHYFKQLQGLGLDLIVVPLQKNIYNVTSETINKYLEGGIFQVPIIAPDMFPYNQIIVHQRNGFLFKEKENLIQELDAVFTNPDLMKSVSVQSQMDVRRNYSYTPQNIEILTTVYN